VLDAVNARVQPLPWHLDAFRPLVTAKPRLPHAVLLQGPRGIGKLAFARALSQALLCERPAADGNACGQCPACGWFANAAHPDYRQVEPASVAEPDGDDGDRKSNIISVQQVRALADFVNMSSHRNGFKIVVIHPADALNVNAANALLKSLEEPPPLTCFILVAHRPQLLPVTVRSRCRQVALVPPAAGAAAAWLNQQGAKQPDLALAMTGNAPLLALDLDGSGYWGARAALLRHLSGDALDPMAAADAVRDCPIAYVIEWLQKWSYDLVWWQTLNRVRYNIDHADVIARMAQRMDALATLRFHREMVNLQPFAHHPLNARLTCESVLLGYRDLLATRAVGPS
jgi:DNA polymerase-3 subunit delta'